MSVNAFFTFFTSALLVIDLLMAGFYITRLEWEWVALMLCFAALMATELSRK